MDGKIVIRQIRDAISFPDELVVSPYVLEGSSMVLPATKHIA